MFDAQIFLAGTGQSELIFACALIGALGLGAQWIAWRIQAPAIVLMALAGMAVGPLWAVIFGTPLLDPDHTFGELLRPIVSLAVAVILFEGGLVLKFENLRDAGPAVRRHGFCGRPACMGARLVCGALCRRARLGQRDRLRGRYGR